MFVIHLQIDTSVTYHLFLSQTFIFYYNTYVLKIDNT